MIKYIALLRGINVGGNNKIAMPDLKKAFIDSGFLNVTTYINSGNVIFESCNPSECELKQICEDLILKYFNLKINVTILSASDLLEAVKNAPLWWNMGKESKHNAIFVIPPVSAAEICEEVGNIKPEYEQIAIYGRVIFWSAPLKTFSKTRWAGVASSKMYPFITIRNANTILKLVELSKIKML